VDIHYILYQVKNTIKRGCLNLKRDNLFYFALCEICQVPPLVLIDRLIDKASNGIRRSLASLGMKLLSGYIEEEVAVRKMDRWKFNSSMQNRHLFLTALSNLMSSRAKRGISKSQSELICRLNYTQSLEIYKQMD
jgi:hypothetical protein